KVIQDQQIYELYDNGQKIADLQIVKVGGGSKMPTTLTQNVIDVGFGGVAAVFASVDSGSPIKLISPLHFKGDMFVVAPDFKADTWEEFVDIAKNSDTPLRIGYKSPVAVAKIVFEEALKHEGVTFSSDPADSTVNIHMINVKGDGKLNVSLAGDLIDGYAGNNPFPAQAVEKGIGKIICDLEQLPPGTFMDHPCCCIAARTDAIEKYPHAITALLTLYLQASQTINTDLDKAVSAAVRWIGTTETVEKMSIPTSGYSMEPSEYWHQTMYNWVIAMNGLDVFTGKLKELPPQQALQHAFELSLLEKARQKFDQQKP
ncbi:MAG: ABC transporter substrate-binding protein, partial [Planctomycetota bacterium]